MGREGGEAWGAVLRPAMYGRLPRTSLGTRQCIHITSASTQELQRRKTAVNPQSPRLAYSG